MRHLDLGKQMCCSVRAGSRESPFRPPVGLASGGSPEEWEVVFLQMRSDYEAGKGKGAKGCLVNRIVEAELPAESSAGADTPH